MYFIILSIIFNKMFVFSGPEFLISGERPTTQQFREDSKKIKMSKDIKIGTPPGVKVRRMNRSAMIALEFFLHYV